MTALKAQLRGDLTAAMKARDEVRTRTLRMALTSLANEEVAGKAPRELSDDEVLRVLTKEAKRRREAAEAFESAGRTEQAAAERAEGEVLAAYLPVPLTDDELAALITVLAGASGGDGGQGEPEFSRWGLPVDKLRYAVHSWQRLTLVQRTHMRGR